MTAAIEREALKVVIDLLRDDDALNDILFSNDAAINQYDTRVWASETEIPDDLPRAEEVRDTLPRVLVEITGSPWEAEQTESDTDARTIRVFTHSFAEAGERGMAEALRTRVIALLASSRLVSPSIMGAGFVLVTLPRPVREPAWRNAWRFTAEHMVGIAGAMES